MNAAVAAFPEEVRGQALEVGDQKSEVGYRKPMVGESKPETRSQKPEVSVDPSEDVGEDAEVATKTEPNLAAEATVAPPPSDDEGYNWPEGSEVASEAVAPTTATPEVANAPLPSLDDLVKRIPADVRETLEDLFRVKFVAVKRIAPSSLKS